MFCIVFYGAPSIEIRNCLYQADPAVFRGLVELHQSGYCETAADKLSFWSCFWYSRGQAVILVLLLIQPRTRCHSGPASDTAADKLSFWSCFWYSCGQAVILVLLLVHISRDSEPLIIVDSAICIRWQTVTLSFFKCIFLQWNSVVCSCIWYVNVTYLQDDYCESPESSYYDTAAAKLSFQSCFSILLSSLLWCFENTYS